jgi:hypothetical protein
MFNDCVQRSKDAHAVAIMDDLTLYGPPESVFRCYDSLLQSLADTGLQLNIQKNKVLWPSPTAPTPESVLNGIKQRGLTLEIGAMEVLGTMVGLDSDKIQKWIHEHVKSSHAQLFTSAPRPTTSAGCHGHPTPLYSP